MRNKVILLWLLWLVSCGGAQIDMDASDFDEEEDIFDEDQDAEDEDVVTKRKRRPRQKRVVTLLPGDTAPPIAVDGWVKPGQFDIQSTAIDPAGEEYRGVTVVELFASWCPASRAILANHDKLQAELTDKKVRIVALTAESVEVTRRFAELAGFENIGVASAQLGKQLDAYLGRRGDLEFPTALVIDSREGSRAVFAWGGKTSLSDDLKGLLTSISSGEFDLDEARAAEERSRAVEKLAASAIKAQRKGNLEKLAEIPAAVGECIADLEAQKRASRSFNRVAWRLLSSEEPNASLALDYSRSAIACDPEQRPAVLDTYALALSKNEDFQGAFDTQKIAVEKLRKKKVSQAELVPYVERLNTYKDALCQSGESCPELGNLSRATGNEHWEGGIESLYKTYQTKEDSGDVIIVRPPKSRRRNLERIWDDIVADLGKTPLGKGLPVRYANTITKEERRSKVLVLIGSSRSNPITGKALEMTDTRIFWMGIKVGGRLIETDNPILSSVQPNPWNPTLPIVLVTSYRNRDLREGEFFGNVPTTIGRRLNNGRFKLAALGRIVLAGKKKNGRSRFKYLPKKLSGPKAAKDLQELHNELREGYAGYDDTAWALKAKGSSWEQHTKLFSNKLRNKRNWSVEGFSKLLAEYLSVTGDRQLTVTATAPGKTGIDINEQHAAATTAPYFTDLRIRGQSDERVIVSAGPDFSKLVGKKIVEITTIDSPLSAQRDHSYLFPTLPSAIGEEQSAPDDVAEFLVGTLSSDSSVPASVEIKVAEKGSDGAFTETVRLPVHRGRTEFASQDRPASLALSSKPVPLIKVRRMTGAAMDELPPTAALLRQQPVAVLDIRGNTGGKERPVFKWAARFSRQQFKTYAGWGEYDEEEEDPEKKWSCFLPRGRWSQRKWATKATAARSKYEGKLFVITDSKVSATGETFAAISSQVEGAIIVGENTAGCTTYSNTDQIASLTHSFVEVRFGRTKLVPAGRSFKENMGYFPDYWLDTKTPVETIVEHLGPVEGIVEMESAYPRVTATDPTSGAKDVPPSTTEIRIVYSSAMDTSSHSFLTTSEGEFPETTEDPIWSSDNTCKLPVELLPNTHYVLWLNSADYRGFRSRDGLSAIPFKLEFTTGEIAANAPDSAPKATAEGGQEPAAQ